MNATAKNPVAREGMNTPWGKAQHVEQIAEGIFSVSTANHGGTLLDRKRNAQVPDYMRKSGGWYEEDCDWAIAAIVHFDDFAAYHENADWFYKTGPNGKEYESKTARLREGIHSILKNWRPREYTRFTGNALAVEESYVLRKEKFKLESADLIVGTGAFGDWAKNVPKGKVGVVACLGGRGENGQSHNEATCWLVDAERYAARDSFGYIVDADVDEKVDGPFW